MRQDLRHFASGLLFVALSLIAATSHGEEPPTFRHRLTLPLENIPQGYHEMPRYVAFSPDGKSLAATGYERPLQILEVPSGKVLREIKKERGGTGIAFSPQGDWLACGKTMWNLPRGETKPIGTADTFASTSAFAREGHLLVTGARRSEIRLWSVAKNERVAEFDPFAGAGPVDSGLYKTTPQSFSFSPGARLLAASIDYWDDELPNFQLVQLWNLDTRKLHAAFRGQYCWFLPDGESLIYGAEGKIVVKKTDSLETIATLRDSRDIVPMALSRDGRWVAAVSAEKLEIWHLPARRRLCSLPGHTRTICAADFSPDGTLLATSDWGGTIRIWTSAKE